MRSKKKGLNFGVGNIYMKYVLSRSGVYIYGRWWCMFIRKKKCRNQ